MNDDEKRGMERAADIAADIAANIARELGAAGLPDAQRRYLHGKACGARDVEGMIRAVLLPIEQCGHFTMGVRCELPKSHPSSEPHAAHPASVLRALSNKPLPISESPIPMLLWCPACNARHIDVDEFSTKSHHTHSCQTCGLTWRPAIVPTCGVQFLPGFKNDESTAR